MLSEKQQADAWDAMLLLDAGDAFVAAPFTLDAKRDAVVKNAAFLVDQYNATNLDAMTLGDRDLMLGAEALDGLVKRAKFPVLAANVRVAGGDAAVFGDGVIIERAGVKVGIVGLVTHRGAMRAMEREGAPSWVIEAPEVAARRVVDRLKGQGAQVFVALSHLDTPEEEIVARAVPELQLFLGGDSMAVGSELTAVGTAWSASAGQKGKHLALTTLNVIAGNPPGGPMIVRDRAAAIEKRLALADRRIASLERRLEQLQKLAVGADPAGSRPHVPAAAVERQLQGAKAERQLIALELEDVGKVDETKNHLTFESVPLSQQVTDDPAIKAAVDAFRGTVPNPAGGHKH